MRTTWSGRIARRLVVLAGIVATSLGGVAVAAPSVLAAAQAEYTFSNSNGQSVVVSPGDSNPLVVQNGRLVVVDGAIVNATISGLTNSQANTPTAPSGFYLMTAVDNGAGQLATPAIGGVDMSGETGQSRWLTNYPLPGTEDIVVPISAANTASTSVQVASADEFTDCNSEPNGCVLYVRTDHRSSANRAFDVRIPLTFTN